MKLGFILFVAINMCLMTSCQSWSKLGRNQIVSEKLYQCMIESKRAHNVLSEAEANRCRNTFKKEE